METIHFSASSDLPTWAAYVAAALAFASLVFLVIELRSKQRGRIAIAISGMVGIAALMLAVLRPVKIAAKDSIVGARVVLLADTSRSMALPGDTSEPRTKTLETVLRSIRKIDASARISQFSFGEGAPLPLAEAASAEPIAAIGRRSDLTSAIRAVVNADGERAEAIFVISDGRLDEPSESTSDEALSSLARSAGVPIHTVAVATRSPKDASVRDVAGATAAVAHVPLPLKVDVGCSGLPCDELTVTARELRDGEPPALLATGLAHLKDGKGTVDLTVTLERAGARIVEVAIASPNGDEIPENDRRLLTVSVSRERVRVLHVAGRVTNDVRALRQWLKSDASVDVVAFFILRTPADNPQALTQDLALIPFPVNELFNEHLPSFDAVVLQDFDAQPYGLEQHLPALARYVRDGGGLIMVGGPNSFVAGGYAGSPLADVLPVSLDGTPGSTAADTSNVTPSWTDAGRMAPLLSRLRAITGDELPEMAGANVLGDARPGATVLWTHPKRVTKSGAPMPLLVVGDQGNGRSIGIGVDGTWLLQFSTLGANTAGRGYAALWDGLLGWLMRDPRYEAALVKLSAPCLANVPTRLELQSAAGNASSEARIEVTKLGSAERVLSVTASFAAGAAEVTLPPLPTGGYSAKVTFGPGVSTRRDFACEAGGEEWEDSRPDPLRLERIARAFQGRYKTAASVGEIPLPKPKVVSAERHVVPLAPPWAWSLIAALFLGVHWFFRRQAGLT